MANDFRSIFLPYCLEKQPDGRYVVLNRRYKPVGFWTKEEIAYNNYPVVVELNGITPTFAAKVSWNGSEDTNRVFLYDDSCDPSQSSANMHSYLTRVERLSALELKSPFAN